MMHRSYEQRLNDYYKKKKKGPKSTLDRLQEYKSDRKISVNKNEEEIEEVDYNEDRRDVDE